MVSLVLDILSGCW